MFNVVAQPNNWAKVIKGAGKLTEGKKIWLDFWQRFVIYAEKQAKFNKMFNSRTALPQHWYDLPAGSSKFHISLTALLTKKRIGAEIYINDNKELYQQFASHKADIEAEIGIKLNWQELPKKKASRISVYKENVDITNVNDEKEQFNWLIDRAVSFRKAFEKYAY